MLASAGFGFLKRIDAGARNQARLYRRLESSPLSGVLSAGKIAAAKVVDESIPKPKVKPNRIKTRKEKKVGHPNPDQLKLPSLCIERLREIPTGKKAFSDYQRHVRQMMKVLFAPDELRDLTLEVEILDGIKKVDLFAKNKSREGFFYSLKVDYNLTCPVILIECKNYKDDIANPEIDQLAGRLGKKLGMVGILAFRHAQNRDRLMKRCQAVFNDDEKGKVILPLCDKDFIKLLELKTEGKDVEIESYLDDLLLEVRAQTKKVG